eukprot:TRINITY_DN6140_c0_g1_i8.p1 TRINITY_DN6140_c0_g1~~TRINITY_DN6140_c0_g1_i8.p1  ORF type:complete len:488 (+),score=121.61 TRINITY_DN6140_c0_g1_i8:117-1580(+)
MCIRDRYQRRVRERATSEMGTWKVKLYVYDLSMGMARQLSPGLLGREIPAIYHTGIAAYNREFFFGGGIQEAGEPNPMWTSQPGMQHEIIELGETSKTPGEFRAFLGTISHRFTQATYDLMHHNCNNFTDECARFLLGQGIPAHITGLPQEFLSTPIGAMLRPMIDGFQQQMMGQGQSMDPFGGQQQQAANPWGAGQTLGAAQPAPAAANPWQALAPPTAAPAVDSSVSTRHKALILTFRQEYNRPLLSSDCENQSVLGRVITASGKLPQELQFTAQEIATLKDAVGSEEAASILCRAHAQWPVNALGSLLWLLRWVVTQETGNTVVAASAGTLQAVASRLGEMPATARMMGLAMLANMCAHTPGKQAVSSDVMLDVLVEAILPSMDAPEALERRTAAALLYNVTLETSTRLPEIISIQLVCSLFQLINAEQDKETLSRLLAALAHTCLLYTSDAADEEDSVDLGGRRIIKKKKKGNKQMRVDLNKD